MDSPLPSSSSSSGQASPASRSRRKLRVAIVGSGLTGLHAAHALATTSSPSLDIEVHLFERASKIGLDSNSIDVPAGSSDDSKGETMRIDVPMRSINAGYYPKVAALYRKLGVPLRKSDFTYSFATEATGLAKAAAVAQKASTTDVKLPASSVSRVPCPSLLYEGSSGIRGFSLPSSLKRRPSSSSSLKDKRSAQAFVHDLSIRFEASRVYLSSMALFALGYFYLLIVSLWHHYAGHTRNPSHPIARQTLQDYFSASPSSTGGIESLFVPSRPTLQHFLHSILVPLFSAMMTVQASSVLQAPVADIMDYVALTFGRSHLTAAAGVLEVERRISAPLEEGNVHVDCLVQRLARKGGEGRLCIEVIEGQNGSQRAYEGFDHVILATQANQSAGFVESLCDGDSNGEGDDGLREMLDRLRCFTYEDSQVVNHTDRSLLSEREDDWRDLNLVSPAAGAVVTGRSEKVNSTSSSPTSRSSSPYSPSTLQANTHTMASHLLLRRLCPSTGEDQKEEVLIQTTNPLSHLSPHPSTILSSSHFERAVLTMSGKEAQRGLFEWRRRSSGRLLGGWNGWELELGELQGKVRVWVCGSWSPGIPLLEGCVVSSGLVVRELVRAEEERAEKDARRVE
ncbi:hypothetical protein BDZ90DRAFT_231753 [Jaminaea rosea]|uniref:Amine oxidase domain-containing protein n=1 Tax=Jaminaea rosea TaxID=1569628 RepID=A0A316URP1_9BASI|nr:hypothetical protein BDZ90DRAFT_231753 [Jaminaea rosea]PWN27979.1 hypothetical protein BDZ90DRAFT_231753 [Jaminaea rosea]